MPVSQKNPLLFDSAPRMNVKCRATLSTAQLNLTDGTYTLVALDTETYDVGSDFDTTTHLFTAPVTGYYEIMGNIMYGNLIALKTYKAAIYVDGVIAHAQYTHSGWIDNVAAAVSTIYKLTAGQTVGLYARVDCGSNAVDISGGVYTSLSIHLLSID